jgi:hypothetical protein
MVTNNMDIFCSALATAGSRRRALLRATPYKLFLKVTWINRQLAISDFTFRTKKKGHWCFIQ